jgi:hypothetical protein
MGDEAHPLSVSACFQEEVNATASEDLEGNLVSQPKIPRERPSTVEAALPDSILTSVQGAPVKEWKWWIRLSLKDIYENCHHRLPTNSTSSLRWRIFL